MLTKQTIRDVLALSSAGLSIEDLVSKIKQRLETVSHNEIMQLVLVLKDEGQVEYNFEVGTWKSKIKLV